MSEPVARSVAVVIPAYHCAGTIGQVLDALLNQSVRPGQIVVVNDRSPDHLADMLAGYGERIEIVNNPANLGLAKSYNAGLGRVDADYVMTLHSDCVLAPDYIRNLLRILEQDESVAVATGQYLFPGIADMSFTDRLYLALNLIPWAPEETAGKVQQVSFIEGKADLFRSSCLRAVGFFDEHFVLTSEDQDLSVRLRQRGWRLVQDPASHFASAFGGTQDTVRKVIRKQRTYARGQAFIVLKYGRQAYESTTANRNRRARHRFAQLASTGVGTALLLGAWWWPGLAGAWAGWVAVRYFSYLALCSWVGRRARWAAAAMGLWSDVWYAVGFAEGAGKALFLGRT